jgi:hypothetical protein
LRHRQLPARLAEQPSQGLQQMRLPARLWVLPRREPVSRPLQLFAA